MADSGEPIQSASPSGASAALLRTLVLCDLADSTALVERMGDSAAAELLRKHDRLARTILHRHGGREIDKTDGFLLLFERPIQAVAFALEYQRNLMRLGVDQGQPMRARVGIHVGDVVVWDNAAEDVAQGAKPQEVEGLVKPVCARLMSLALPGQVLLSGVAHSLALRGAHELGEVTEGLRWQAHGNYRFKGVHDPMAVIEVGERAVAPFRSPPNTAKAWRDTPVWRRAPSLIAALVAIAATAFGWWYLHRPEPGIAFVARDWVVVADLQNLTGDKLLDTSMDTAFRLGLQQSRYVNVLTDMQVRQALARMQRDPSVPIDRMVAAEIALREGAKAVIVPSISTFGRKLRIVAELLDPVGPQSVAVETMEADGMDDVLPQTDKLLVRLRARLGESLKQIESTSAPLEKVTTANLEALKAYSVSISQVHRGGMEEAIRLLDYATELDPEFAVAYARAGSLLYSQQRTAEARAKLEQALAIEDRLSERERLYIKAQLSRFGAPKEMVERWRLYASLYPDDAAGPNNVGNLYYMLYNDYANSATSLTAAADPRHPLRNLTLHTRGYVHLAMEQLDAAMADFNEAARNGPAALYFGLADGATALGEHERALSYLRDAPRQAPVFEAERVIRAATCRLDSGELGTLADELQTSIAAAAALPSPGPLRRLYAAEFALARASERTDAARTRVMERIDTLSRELDDAALPSLETPENLLYWGLWAARLGLNEAAALALTRVDAAQRMGYPVREELAMLIEAEMALAAGDAPRAVSMLRTRVTGFELWELHQTLAQAYAASGERERHEAELTWLVEHRGRALGQWIDQLLGQGNRILDWNRAAVTLAQAHRAHGTQEPADALRRRLAPSWRARADAAPE
jgi:putative peptide modification system cyclase